jgi:hypothetical protein
MTHRTDEKPNPLVGIISNRRIGIRISSILVIIIGYLMFAPSIYLVRWLGIWSVWLALFGFGAILLSHLLFRYASSPFRTLILNQLQNRPPDAEHEWWPDPEKRAMLQTVLTLYSVQWHPKRFIPEDPFWILVQPDPVWNDSVHEIYETGTDYFGRFWPLADAKRFLKLTLGEVVDYFLAHRPIESVPSYGPGNYSELPRYPGKRHS